MRLRDDYGLVRLTPRRVLRGIFRRAGATVTAAILDLRGSVSHRALVDPSGPAIVSLTSYSVRLESVHRTIESIGRGRVRPRRLILWVDAPGYVPQEHPNIERLIERGLEIRTTDPSLGPHKKYYPALDIVLEECLPLVTADDDVLYPRRWLATLAAGAYDGRIVAFRARKALFRHSGIVRYRDWPVANADDHPLFFTGVSGVLYPPEFADTLRDAGTAFMRVCARADDIWLNVLARRAGISVMLAEHRSREFLTSPSTQRVSLEADNVGTDANDIQLASTLTDEDRRAWLNASVSSD